jgi:hypothetical protein
MSHNILQDSIQLTLTDEFTVINDTVKVVATVQALVQPNETDAALRGNIRETLRKLIDTDKWQISNLQRTADASGVERVSLTASTRVSESENSNLDNRAREASRPGLNISNVSVDTTTPRAKVEEAERSLRLALLEKARIEADEMNAVMGFIGQGYRVHQVSYSNNGSGNDYSNGMRSKGVMAMAATATSYGSGFGDDDVLGNAQKLSMTAQIVLARVSL